MYFRERFFLKKWTKWFQFFFCSFNFQMVWINCRHLIFYTFLDMQTLNYANINRNYFHLKPGDIKVEPFNRVEMLIMLFSNEPSLVFPNFLGKKIEHFIWNDSKCQSSEGLNRKKKQKKKFFFFTTINLIISSTQQQTISIRWNVAYKYRQSLSWLKQLSIFNVGFFPALSLSVFASSFHCFE